MDGQWSQFGHAMLRHRVADDEHAGHHRPPNTVGSKNWKSAEPLSDGFEKVLILDSGFRKQGEGERLIIVFIMFLWLRIQSSCLARGCFCMS